MLTNPKLQKDMELLLDIFTGADGCAGFMKLQGAIEVINKRAEQGDEDSVTIIRMFTDFCNLTRVLIK